MAVRELVPKVYQSAAISGVSEQAMQEHLGIYRNYVAKVNEIRASLADGFRQDVNSIYSYYRSLKTSEIDALGAVVLHEIYFGTLCGGTPPSVKMQKHIEFNFGSLERWAADLTASAMAARSWVVLAEDPFDGHLFHCCQDSEGQGVWGCKPLLALDVCEHAYSMDFGTQRRNYINAFIKAINWKSVETRLEKEIAVLEDGRETADAKLSSLFYYPVYPVYRGKRVKKRIR